MSTVGAEEVDTESLIDGRAIASQIFAETSAELEVLKQRLGSLPGIRVVMVGDDGPSGIYARRILKSAERVGAPGEVISVASSSGIGGLRALLRELSDDASVGGVIVQLPLPAGLDIRHAIEALDPLKDVDGIHPFNAGLISTRLHRFRAIVCGSRDRDPASHGHPGDWAAHCRDRTKSGRGATRTAVAPARGRHRYRLPSPNT